MNGSDHHELRFPIMGSHGHVIVVGADAEASCDRAQRRLVELEQRWSRFVPTSDVSRLNGADGLPCIVSADTTTLVDSMVQAWRATNGRFDPTVHDIMHAVGYATTWVDVTDRSVDLSASGAMPAPGCAGIDFTETAGMVQLPPGVRIDPGGIGKGLAADIVANEIIASGAVGVLVNVGGDVRVIGTAPAGDHWTLDVADPDPARTTPLRTIALTDGGVATSTSFRRKWNAADGTELHHIVDPGLGAPAVVDRVQVTAVASTAWWAEVVAKVVFLDGQLPRPDGDDLQGDTSAVVVGHDGTIRVLGDDRWFAQPHEQVEVQS